MAAVRLARALAPGMKARGGGVIHLQKIADDNAPCLAGEPQRAKVKQPG